MCESMSSLGPGVYAPDDLKPQTKKGGFWNILG